MNQIPLLQLIEIKKKILNNTYRIYTFNSLTSTIFNPTKNQINDLNRTK